MDAFLDAKNIPADEQVMVAGDLNVDSHSAEYDSMLANGGLAPADSRTGHPYSFDTQENSIAKYRYPDDPREDLDYVLHRKGHARPAGLAEHRDQGGVGPLDGLQLGQGVHLHQSLRSLSAGRRLSHGGSAGASPRGGGGGRRSAVGGRRLRGRRPHGYARAG